MKLTRAQGLALAAHAEIEAALLRGNWGAVRDAAIRLAALAADRAAKQKA